MGIWFAMFGAAAAEKFQRIVEVWAIPPPTSTTENPPSARSAATNNRNKAKPLRSVDGGIIPEGRKLETITEIEENEQNGAQIEVV